MCGVSGVRRNGAMQRSSWVLRSNSLFLFFSCACLVCTQKTSKNNARVCFDFAVRASEAVAGCCCLLLFYGVLASCCELYYLPLAIDEVMVVVVYLLSLPMGAFSMWMLASRFPVFPLVVGTSAKFLKLSKVPWPNCSQEWHAMMSSRKKTDVASLHAAFVVH